MMNRRAGLNLITQAATEAVQQWARDIKKMRMGILVVIHTFGADMKWHPHIHLILTGGGLSLDMTVKSFASAIKIMLKAENSATSP